MARKPRRRQGGSPNRRTTIVGGGGHIQAPAQRPKPGAWVSGGPQRRTVAGPLASYNRVAPPKPPAPTKPTPGAGSEALRANAREALDITKSQNRDAIYRAVMNLGDPTLFAKYQKNPDFAGYKFTQDPNSLFATLARQEKEGLQNIDVNANAGNTFFSGRRLADRKKLTDEGGRQRLAGSTSLSDDLKELARVLGLAQSDYGLAIAQADQMDIDAALERDRLAREEWLASLAPAVNPQTGAPLKGLGPPTASLPSASRRATEKFARRRRRRR